VKKGEIMKKVLKRIGSIAIDILIIIVFIVSSLVVVASITANRTGGQPSVMGYVFSSVQTNSMQGTIDKGDFVVGKLIDDDTEIKVGDIISFYDYFQGKQIVITHRVVEILDPNIDPGYITQGDNEKMSDDIVKSRNDIQSVYKFRIPFLGGFIDFLKTPLGFILCLVLPLLGFIAWQAYKLVSLYLKSKKLELEEEAEKISKTKSELSEEEKNAIIAEYLAKQAQAEQEQVAKSAEQKTQASKADASRSNTAQKSQGAQPKKQNNASGNKRKGKR
jgi:signal peptidase